MDCSLKCSLLCAIYVTLKTQKARVKRCAFSAILDTMAAAHKPRWEFHIKYTSHVPGLDAIQGLSWHSSSQSQSEVLSHVWECLTGEGCLGTVLGTFPVLIQRLSYSNVKYVLVGAQCFESTLVNWFVSADLTTKYFSFVCQCLCRWIVLKS